MGALGSATDVSMVATPSLQLTKHTLLLLLSAGLGGALGGLLLRHIEGEESGRVN